MLGCSCVLLSFLLMVTMFHCSTESLNMTQENPELVSGAGLKGQGGGGGGGNVQRAAAAAAAQKSLGPVSAKLLLLDQLLHLENDVIETKRKRSFPGSNTPLDRLSISTMDPKNNKQRKVVELPRRRVTVPIDRIGVGRLPNTRG